MRLFLIRHGETVDNVTGILAGRRDSALTNHGAEQARRLSDYLAENRASLTRIFSSTLQRAYKTASMLAAKQTTKDLSVSTVPYLIERDFGYYEGKTNRVRKGPDAEEHKKEPGFVDVESKDELAVRADLFLDLHLLPLLDDEAEFGGAAEHVVAVVSHGILLSSLWRRLLLRLGPKSVTVDRDVVSNRGPVALAHLGGWSNTGFLELSIQSVDAELGSELSPADAGSSPPEPDATVSVSTLNSPGNSPGEVAPPQLLTESSGIEMPTDQSDVVGDVSVTKNAINAEPSEKEDLRLLEGYRTTILVVDGQQHLQGLKRQRGGIGRAEHDDKQQSMTSFFKKARKD
ncbi:phosphoglycerate mutase-like protein [Aureobasidium subglaciale]|nr:phosphoglycerate mutase-like protein [Aureobasidium subglaciale]